MNHSADSETMEDTRDSHSKDSISPLWKVLRDILILTCVVAATVLYMVHGYSRAVGSTGLVKPKHVKPISPLQDMLDRGNSLAVQVLNVDSEIMMRVYESSTLQLKTLVIMETVVPCSDHNRLSMYVKSQLRASDVMSQAQKDAVLAMVDLAPVEAVVSNEEIGERGSLRNSAVLALIRIHDNRIHFMLIGVQAEARLRWNWIPSVERNAWNDVLSRVLANKIRKEVKNMRKPEATVSDPSQMNRVTAR